MSKKKIIIGVCGLVLAVCCVFAWDYVMSPSSKGVGDDVFTLEEEEQMRRELKEKGLPTSIRETKELEYEQQ